MQLETKNSVTASNYQLVSHVVRKSIFLVPNLHVKGFRNCESKFIL